MARRKKRTRNWRSTARGRRLLAVDPDIRRLVAGRGLGLLADEHLHQAADDIRGTYREAISTIEAVQKGKCDRALDHLSSGVRMLGSAAAHLRSAKVRGNDHRTDYRTADRELDAAQDLFEHGCLIR